MDSEETGVSIISYTHADDIPFRKQIPIDLVKQNAEKLLAVREFRGSPEKLFTPYGADSRILQKFEHFGHAEFDGSGWISAFRDVVGNLKIPFVSLTAANSIEITDSQITVNGAAIDLNRKGDFIPNYAPKAAFAKASYAFMGLVARTRKGMDLDVIKPGDFVVILPAMYTGNTDFKSTPLGTLPGGLIVTSVIDTVLSKNWIKYVQVPGLILFFMGILAFLAGCLTRPWIAVGGTFAICLLTVILSIIIFSSANTVFSFTLPLINLGIGVFSAIIITNSANEVEERRVARELEVAALVQNSFLRNGSIRLGETLNVTGKSISATECGGDWWTGFHRAGYSYIVIGDAVGHGVSAALITAVVFSITRLINEEMGHSMPDIMTPSAMLKKLNNILCGMGNDSAYMTFQIMRIHDSTGECLYSNAGNLHPILIPQDPNDPRLTNNQKTKTLVIPGEVLGSSNEVDYQDREMLLKVGDQIMMYTDGLIENLPKYAKAPNGRAWLKKILHEASELRTPERHNRVWDAYFDRIGDVPPADDTTIVSFYRS